MADLSTMKRAGVPILRSLNIRFRLKQHALTRRVVIKATSQHASGCDGWISYYLSPKYASATNENPVHQRGWFGYPVKDEYQTVDSVFSFEWLCRKRQSNSAANQPSLKYFSSCADARVARVDSLLSSALSGRCGVRAAYFVLDLVRDRHA